MRGARDTDICKRKIEKDLGVRPSEASVERRAALLSAQTRDSVLARQTLQVSLYFH